MKTSPTIPAEMRLSRPPLQSNTWMLPDVQLTSVEYERVSFWTVLRRLGVWALGLLYFSVKRLNDRRRGQRNPTQLGRRIRQMLEYVGGTAVKLGQQLSMRVDMLPFEICEELDQLLDAVPPFALSSVTGDIEAAVGAPLSSIFQRIEEEPIGSASIASVFKATLHDGTDVALKIRRPGVPAEFQADLIVFNVLTRAMEFLTFARFGFFHHLRTELWSMLTNELDFRKEADLQHLFWKKLQEDNIREVTAPRVFMQWCSDRVMVSEFVDALSTTDLLLAIETNDAAKLETWRAQGIEPSKVARNLMELSFWGSFEAPFYHADPHPGNILIRPNNQIVMLDFGACGQVPHWQHVPQTEFLKRALNHDYGGAAALGVTASGPLPYVDVEEVTDRMQDVFWRSSMARFSKHSDWWERTSAAGWQKTVEALGEFNIQANAETLRNLRSSLLYETLVSRIDPALAQRNAINRWFKRFAKRTKQKLKKEAKRRGEDEMREEWHARGIELNHLRQASGVNNRIRLTRMPGDFRQIVSAAAYTSSQVLSSGIVILNLLALMTIGVVLYHTSIGTDEPLIHTLHNVTLHPVTLSVTAMLCIRTWRKVSTRLLSDQVRRD